MAAATGIFGALAAPAAGQVTLPPVLPPGDPPEEQPPPQESPPPQNEPPGSTSSTGSAVVYRGSVARTSYTQANEVVPPLELVWARQLGRDLYPPVMGDGRIFTLAGRTIRGREHLDDRVFRLSAFDAATGRERWHRDELHGVQLAYDSGRVFVAGGKVLAAYDAATGAPLWSLGRAGDEDARSYFAPIASDGLVYAGNGGSTIEAFDAATGNLVWSQNAGSAGSSYAALWRGRVFTSNGCDIDALDARTGAKLWSYRTGCSTGGSDVAVVQDGRVYGREEYSQYPPPALDAESGKRAGPPVQAHVFAPGIAFAQSSGITATDLASGNSLWTARGPEPHSGYDLRPVGVGSTVWGLDRDAVLSGYGLRSGDLRDRVRLLGDNYRVDAVQDVSLAAGEGVLAVPVSGRLIVLRSAIRPARGGAAVRVREPDIRVGSRTWVDGRLGDGVGASSMRLEADPYPYGKFSAAGSAPVDPGDRSFRHRVRPDRNTRYRVRAADGSVVSGAATAYVYPLLRISGRDTGRSIRASASVRGAKGVSLAGRRLVVYLARARSETFERLGAGTLRRSGSIRARATLTLRRFSTGADDGIVFCIRGLRAMGRPDRLAKRCGASRVK